MPGFTSEESEAVSISAIDLVAFGLYVLIVAALFIAVLS